MYVFCPKTAPCPSSPSSCFWRSSICWRIFLLDSRCLESLSLAFLASYSFSSSVFWAYLSLFSETILASINLSTANSMTSLISFWNSSSFSLRLLTSVRSRCRRPISFYLLASFLAQYSLYSAPCLSTVRARSSQDSSWWKSYLTCLFSDF